jgi:hypothetical protein
MFHTCICIIQAYVRYMHIYIIHAYVCIIHAYVHEEQEESRIAFVRGRKCFSSFRQKISEKSSFKKIVRFSLPHTHTHGSRINPINFGQNRFHFRSSASIYRAMVAIFRWRNVKHIWKWSFVVQNLTCILRVLRGTLPFCWAKLNHRTLMTHARDAHFYNYNYPIVQLQFCNYNCTITISKWY